MLVRLAYVQECGVQAYPQYTGNNSVDTTPGQFTAAGCFRFTVLRTGYSWPVLVNVCLAGATHHHPTAPTPAIANGTVPPVFAVEW